MSDADLDSAAAIVSPLEGKPLIYAARSEPVDEIDSGWQFSANPEGGGDEASTQIWSIAEVLAAEPSLQTIIGLPPGAVASRASTYDDWIVQSK